jgi:hypothetical protein
MNNQHMTDSQKAQWDREERERFDRAQKKAERVSITGIAILIASAVCLPAALVASQIHETNAANFLYAAGGLLFTGLAVQILAQLLHLRASTERQNP